MWNRATGNTGKPTLYYDDTEKKAISVEGTRNTRNNNPGNMEYGSFCKARGAIGTDGRFAIFATPDAGFLAMRDLLQNHEKYKGKTVEKIINTWAPAFENDTKEYVKVVCKLTGLEAFAVPKSELEYQMLVEAMARHEGYFQRKNKVTEIPYFAVMKNGN